MNYKPKHFIYIIQSSTKKTNIIYSIFKDLHNRHLILLWNKTHITKNLHLFTDPKELNNPEELNFIKSSKNWGFCQQSCSFNGKLNADYLQEAELSLLSNPECQIKGEDLGVDVHKELCALKKYSRKIAQYQQLSGSSRLRFKRLRR